jgi:hypothetical protein
MAGPQTSWLAWSISTSQSISAAVYLRARDCRPAVALDQAGALGAAVAAGASKIRQHHAAVTFAQAGVGKPLSTRLMGVALAVSSPFDYAECLTEKT